MPKVALVMGSLSDFKSLEGCIKLLKKFKVETEVRVISAHRTPEQAAEFAKSAEERGIEVILAAAGKAAHLAGVLASMTALPVIGIPMNSSTMDGLDSLLSTVQMPTGIPVATVAINGGGNAALLAVQMLSIKYPELRAAMKEYRAQQTQEVVERDKEAMEMAEKL
ncbi:MAG TPA: 5-(carboxyamino)imidazole ribonucleotide mutase [Candidatus Faecaligallichristensenella faecipullorum]|nr:5-(carboxyamino)imidazole ribonucleotide mutase [Candidatus Faecaligallichristensenella faecipullorum]